MPYSLLDPTRLSRIILREIPEEVPAEEAGQPTQAARDTLQGSTQQSPPTPPVSDLQIQQAANVVYNEAAGLRPTTSRGPGSPEELSNARTAMARVLYNRWLPGRAGGHAPGRLTQKGKAAVQSDPRARDIYLDGQRGAERAAHMPDRTRGAQTFYHALEGQKRPPWAQGTPVQRFGPFLNTAPGHRRVGARVYVEIHP